MTHVASDTTSCTLAAAAAATAATAATTTQQHNRRISQSLYQQYLEQTAGDFTFLINTRDGQQCSKSCHRAVLQAGADIPSDTDVLEISGYNVDSALETIKFLYINSCDISYDNVQQLAKLSSDLRASELTELCFQFMQEKVNAENCLRYYDTCLTCNASRAVQGCLLSFITENFAKMNEENTTKQCSLEAMKNIVGCLESCFSNIVGCLESCFSNIVGCLESCFVSERAVFEFVVQWSRDNPTESVLCLLKMIRYEKIEPEYLAEVVIYNPVILTLHKPQGIQDRIRAAVQTRNRHASLMAEQSHYRNKLKIRIDKANNKLCTFDFCAQNWIPTKLETPEWVDDTMLACTHNTWVVFIGDNQQCYLADVADPSRSRELPNLPRHDAVHDEVHLCHAGGVLYAILSTKNRREAYTHTKLEIYSLELVHDDAPEWHLQESVRCRSDAIQLYRSWYSEERLFIMYAEEQSVVRMLSYDVIKCTWKQCTDCPKDVLPVGKDNNSQNIAGVLHNGSMCFFTNTQKLAYNAKADEWSTNSYKSRKVISKLSENALLDVFMCTDSNELVVCEKGALYRCNQEEKNWDKKWFGFSGWPWLCLIACVVLTFVVVRRYQGK